MIEQKRYRQVADAAITLVAEELRPWMEGRLAVWLPDGRGRVAPYDPSYLAWTLLDRWFVEFSRDLGADNHIYIHNYRTFRNQWAHHVPLDEEAMTCGLRACRRLLGAVGSTRIDELGAERAEPFTHAGLAAPTVGVHRRMSDARFREEQWQHRFDARVAPINDLVDDLIEEHSDRWVPYIPAYHGGIESEILWLFQDPGKMTSTAFGGSGFLGCENDDPSAETAAKCLDMAGIEFDLVTPWNAYPWFQPEQGGVKPAMLDEGLDALVRLLALMPQVHSVVAGGGAAKASWRKLKRAHPTVAAAYRLTESLHTSGRGVTSGSRHSKQEGMERVAEDLRRATVPPS